MKNAVVIKSYPNGLSVYLDNSISYEDLLYEIAAKFQETNHFFKDASVVISFEGRELTEEQEREIIQTIMDNSSLNILCLMGKNDDRDLTFYNIQNKLLYQKSESCGEFYYGTLKDGQSFESDKSVIVMGDVYPGCSVYSTKDIIVMGGLYGEAYAGANGENNHFVCALEMSPERLRIGDFKYRPEKPSRWGIKPKVVPKIAYCIDGKVYIEPITKESLNKIL